MARGTKVETEHRINTVYKWLSEGNSRAQVVQLCADKWRISERHSDNYMRRAREKLMEDCELERPAWIAEALQRLRIVEQQAMKKNQPASAINAIQLQAKLIGIEL
jgi:hypothetical protein